MFWWVRVPQLDCYLQFFAACFFRWWETSFAFFLRILCRCFCFCFLLCFYYMFAFFTPRVSILFPNGNFKRNCQQWADCSWTFLIIINPPYYTLKKKNKFCSIYPDHSLKWNHVTRISKGNQRIDINLLSYIVFFWRVYYLATLLRGRCLCFSSDRQTVSDDHGHYRHYNSYVHHRRFWGVCVFLC